MFPSTRGLRPPGATGVGFATQVPPCAGSIAVGEHAFMLARDDADAEFPGEALGVPIMWRVTTVVEDVVQVTEAHLRYPGRDDLHIVLEHTGPPNGECAPLRSLLETIQVGEQPAG